MDRGSNLVTGEPPFVCFFIGEENIAGRLVQDVDSRRSPRFRLVGDLFGMRLFWSVPRYYAVWLSDNPGPFVEEDGTPKGVIVTAVNDPFAEPPKTNLFATACSSLDLGHPRISSVLPFLEEFNPAAGWRSVAIGTQTFWTNCEPNSFPVT